jgi:hypothetical protein
MYVGRLVWFQGMPVGRKGVMKLAIGSVGSQKGSDGREKDQ